MVDHQRCGRLEASSQHLSEWLLSDSWLTYSAAFSPPIQEDGQALLSASEYLAVEAAHAAKSGKLYQVVCRYEETHCSSLQTMAAEGLSKSAQRKPLATAIINGAVALSLTDQVVHSAVALMDNTVAATGKSFDGHSVDFSAACLRIAAAASAVDSDRLAVADANSFAAIYGLTGHMVEAMESRIRSVLRSVHPKCEDDIVTITALDVLILFVQRLGCPLSSPSLVKQIAGSSFILVTTALVEPLVLQWSPSIIAASILICCRRHQGCVPAWPSVLSVLTGYSEAGTSSLSAATAFCEGLMPPSRLPTVPC